MGRYKTRSGGENTGHVKRLFGQLLVKSGFVTRSELNAGLEKQVRTNEMLGEILVQMGVLDPADFQAILSVNRNTSVLEDALSLAAGVRIRLGELFLQAGHITPQQLDIALKERQQTGEKLGGIFVRLGLVRKDELDLVLRFQKNQETGIHSHHCLRLGELLVTTGQITKSQLLDSLAHQKASRYRLGEILVGKGYINTGQLARGLKLQRKLLTVVLVSLLSLAPLSAGHSADNASHDEDLAISGSLGTHTALRTVFQTFEFVLTSDDIIRGYIDIPTAAQLEIQNYNLTGYLVIFNGLVGPFKEVHIEGLDRKVVVTSQGGEIAQPYHGRDPLTVRLRYRIVLTDNAKPGKYSCPLTISVSPIIIV